jgi:hypothetical protein
MDLDVEIKALPAEYAGAEQVFGAADCEHGFQFRAQA